MGMWVLCGARLKTVSFFVTVAGARANNWAK